MHVIIRRTYILFLFFIIQTTAFASDSILVWKHATYLNMLNTAQVEQKNIMICMFQDSSYSGSCFMDITKVLSSNKRIAYFLKTNFLTYTVNPTTTEGIELNKKFRLSSYPAFIFLNTSGELLHKLVGYYDQAKILEEANKALSKKKSYSHIKSRYDLGDRHPDVLLNYCYALYNAGEADSNIIRPLIDEYLATQTILELHNPKNIKFIYDFSVVDFKSMLTYDSKAFQFLYHNNNLFLKYFSKENIDIRIVYILYKEAYFATETKDEKEFKKIIDLLRKYDKGKEWDWKTETGAIISWIPQIHLVSWFTQQFYETSEDRKKYDAAFQSFSKDIWNNADDLNDLAWDYFEKITDQSKLNDAIKCIKRSLELHTSSANLDTYAHLLYKTGHYKEALNEAELALEAAKKTNTDIKPYKQSIDTIKAAMK